MVGPVGVAEIRMLPPVARPDPELSWCEINAHKQQHAADISWSETVQIEREELAETTRTLER